jgi:hypothetical protein
LARKVEIVFCEFSRWGICPSTAQELNLSCLVIPKVCADLSGGWPSDLGDQVRSTQCG